MSDMPPIATKFRSAAKLRDGPKCDIGDSVSAFCEISDTGTHSGDGCEQPHGLGETLELSRSLFDELEAGACHQVLHCA
jgi:hypothetical protein